MAKTAEQPKGTWKVDKEFDENGNLTRYDSIYSWSSTDNLDELAQKNPDSLMQSLRSKFYRNFSGIDDQRFGDLFADDSLFTEQFFDDDFFDSEFGEDFMDIDRIRERMETMQQKFWKGTGQNLKNLKMKVQRTETDTFLMGFLECRKTNLFWNYLTKFGKTTEYT